MRICLLLEGSYPYVQGGVSTWVDGFIRSLPDDEFILWTIAESKEKRGKFKYEIPENVVAINENFLDTALNLPLDRNIPIRLKKDEVEAVSQLIQCKDPDWDVLYRCFGEKPKKSIRLFMSKEFLAILKEFATNEFPFVGFTDLFWTVRSMFLPILSLIGQEMPEADLYHSLSTGYAGVIGALCAKKHNKPYVLTEHGIYTREREEEILRADWVIPYFKELWINMFYMYSRFAYQSAHRVTSLFNRASRVQQELGCPPEKCDVINNGIFYQDFADIPFKEDDTWIDIGAIVRVAPIKDIKTMIYTFSRLKQEIKNVRLFILGNIDDEDYYQECVDLIDFLDVKDIRFDGLVDVKSYLARFDFTLLTSISEGQPFAAIESLAARRPLVATNVGSCRELIDGDGRDDLGAAGIYVSPMHQTELLQALMRMCKNKNMREKMGIIGQKRVQEFYDHPTMVKNYRIVYKKAEIAWQESGLN
ncbi:MAG TPA: glycosyl transferase [Anaerolineaceae bacterium]|nr:glycosyl transferase [Anaerolineaceae bacterium]